MPRLRMEQTQSQQMRQEQRQVLRMEQASLLEMPDDEFNRLVCEIERNAFFKRLYRKEKLIRYQRFPGTDISPRFYQLEEGMVADKGSLDVETLLLNKEHVVRQIQKMGLEKFKRYFLFPDSGVSLEEIARECSLPVSEVRKINDLVDEFSIMSEFYHPSDVTSGDMQYSKIASIEKDGKGFIIGYYSAYLARGRYSIEYGRFEELEAAGAFTRDEVKAARQLFKRLELINSRKDTVTQILKNIIEKQTPYLESGDVKSLLPFSQRELAEKIGLVPSSVSRAIRGKSIDTPWGREVPLKHFFPGPKRFKLERLRQVLESDNKLSSDELIRAELWEKFGVAVSRRSVADLRRELKFPAAQRKKHAVRE